MWCSRARGAAPAKEKGNKTTHTLKRKKAVYFYLPRRGEEAPPSFLAVSRKGGETRAMQPGHE